MNKKESQKWRTRLKRMSLIEALWWFIEEREGLEQSVRSEIFFDLRARVRTDA